MAPLVYQQGSEGVVGTEDGNLLSVYECPPSGRVVYLAEDRQSAGSGGDFVAQTVGTVFLQNNASLRGTGIFGGSTLSGLCVEDDGLLSGVNLPECGHLRISGRCGAERSTNQALPRRCP